MSKKDKTNNIANELDSEQNEVALGKELSMSRRLLAFFSIVIVYFFYTYNFMIGIFVKPTMIETVANGGFGFTIQQTETIFAVMSFGTIPGTILFGILASKIGKKYTLSIISGLIALTTFLPLISPTNYSLWLVFRLLTGVTLGGVFGTAMPFVADLFPKKYRGKLAAILTSLFSLAMIFGGQVYAFLGDANWDILMYTAIIPSFIGAIMVYMFVPNDYELTKEINATAKESNEKVNYINMYKGKYLFIGIGVILLSGANFTAYSAFSNNATTYLRNSVGFSAAVAGGIYSLQGIGQLIGYNFWGFISDKFGRKVPLIGMLLSSLFIFLYMRTSNDSVAVFRVLSVSIGIAVGFSGAWGAYYSELFPSRFRSISAGISFNGGRIVSTFAVPAIAGLATSADQIVKIFWAGIIVFGLGTIVWLLLPETINKDKSSEKLIA